MNLNLLSIARQFFF